MEKDSQAKHGIGELREGKTGRIWSWKWPTKPTLIEQLLAILTAKMFGLMILMYFTRPALPRDRNSPKAN
jgi:hypothetical protein